MPKNKWILYYRQSATQLQFKIFEVAGSAGEIHSAVERAHKHCAVMGYKFQRVQPFLSDLDAEEQVHLGLGSAPAPAVVQPIGVK